MCPGESANAQPLDRPKPLQPGHPPVELVAGQHAAGDQVPGLGGDPLVVVADGGQPVLGASGRPVTCISGEPYCRRAQLVQGGERGARVGGLVAERPVQLGGVADRLVDGQPQVGRVDDQVVAAGLDRRRGQLLGQQLGQLRQLGGEVPAGAGQVLPAAAGRRRQRAHGLEPAAWPRPPPRSAPGAAGPAAGAPWWPRRSRTCTPGPAAARRPRGRSRSSASSPALQPASRATLSAALTVERVDLVGRDPLDLAVGRARRPARWARC